jgi:hypothetical protein
MSARIEQRVRDLQCRCSLAARMEKTIRSGRRHIFLPELQRMATDRPANAVYCGSGYRASTTASETSGIENSEYPGKHGKRPNFQLKEPTDNERNGGAPEKKFIRRNDAGRSLVGAAVARLSGTIDLYRLFNVGCISGRALLFRKLHLAILFA